MWANPERDATAVQTIIAVGPTTAEFAALVKREQHKVLGELWQKFDDVGFIGYCWAAAAAVPVDEAKDYFEKLERIYGSSYFGDEDPQAQVVKAAVAMYNGSGGGIGDLKRAARGLIKLRGLQAGRRTGRHLTAQELAIVRLAFPSLHGILGEEHLEEALGALESQGRNWAEELEL